MTIIIRHSLTFPWRLEPLARWWLWKQINTKLKRFAFYFLRNAQTSRLAQSRSSLIIVICEAVAAARVTAKYHGTELTSREKESQETTVVHTLNGNERILTHDIRTQKYIQKVLCLMCVCTACADCCCTVPRLWVVRPVRITWNHEPWHCNNNIRLNARHTLLYHYANACAPFYTYIGLTLVPAVPSRNNNNML